MAQEVRIDPKSDLLREAAYHLRDGFFLHLETMPVAEEVLALRVAIHAGVLAHHLIPEEDLLELGRDGHRALLLALALDENGVVIEIHVVIL